MLTVVWGLGWVVTSIERTAYPRFKRLITAHELHLFFSPSRDELAWAADATDSDEHLLALLLMLKSYRRMGCFPALEDVPEMVVDFVRRAVELPEGTLPVYRAERTAKHHRGLVRKQVGVTYDQARARGIVEQSIRKEAAAKNRPADLINIALEKVVEAGLELPGFSTFDKMASKIRTEVNASIRTGIHDRMSAAQRAGLLRLLEERDSDGTTLYNRLKKPAQGPTWSHFKNLTKRLEWLDGLGDTDVWMEGVAAGKITDFAGEADAADASELRDFVPVTRIALVAALTHKARMRVRDDLATMFCKRVATKIKKARVELEEIRLAEREIVEALTEAAAQALAGWTQMDFMNRRDTLKLAVGAPLILAAERMLGGTARTLNHDHKGFDADTVTALEEVTAFFTKADASKGGGLYRSAIVAQLDEVARRIQDGVPPKLKTRVFAATADLAALAGWVSHDVGRYGIAQRLWSYGTYAAGEAAQPDRGVEIVTRMSHQMIYLGHPQDALGLLGVAAKKATLPATKALVASQTGRVHAALGDERAAERHLGDADDLLADGLDDVPEWVAYFDAAEHAGARAVSARDLAGLHRGRRVASGHFEDALKLRRPGFDRVKVMDRVGLAAALFDEGEVERGAAAAHQALDDAARVDSTLVASRLNTLLDSARPYETAAVEDVRSRARDLATARPTTIAA